MTHDALTHSPTCSKERQADITKHDNGLTTQHCVECGAHVALTADGMALPKPTSTGAMAGLDEYRLEATMETTR